MALEVLVKSCLTGQSIGRWKMPRFSAFLAGIGYPPLETRPAGQLLGCRG
jgi:hypothetical protein